MLLIAEQGLGDTIQFIRYAPMLKQMGATVIFECPEKLMKLLSGCAGVDVLYPPGADATRARRLCALAEPAGAPGHIAGDVPGRGPVPSGRTRAGRALAGRAGGVSRVQGGDQLAGEPEVRGRLPPLDAVAALRRAGPGARGAALQPAEVRRGRAAQRAWRPSRWSTWGAGSTRDERAVHGHGGGA